MMIFQAMGFNPTDVGMAVRGTYTWVSLGLKSQKKVHVKVKPHVKPITDYVVLTLH